MCPCWDCMGLLQPRSREGKHLGGCSSAGGILGQCQGQWGHTRGKKVLSRGPLRQKGQVLIWETWQAKGSHSCSLRMRGKEVGCPREMGFASVMRKSFLHFLKGGGKCFWSSQSLASPVSVPGQWCGCHPRLLKSQKGWHRSWMPVWLCLSTSGKSFRMCVFPGRSSIFYFAVFSNLLPLMSVPCGPLDVQGQGNGELLPRITMSFPLCDENCKLRTWPEFVRNSRIFPEPEVTTNFFLLLRKGYQMPVNEFLCVSLSAELWFQWKLEIVRDREFNQESLEWLPSAVACSPLEQE